MANEKEEEVFITTGNDFHGYTITKYLGIVSDIYFGRATTVWTHKDYQKVCDTLLDRLRTKAGELGANAILGVRFDFFDDAAWNSKAYGTAVFIEPESSEIK